MSTLEQDASRAWPVLRRTWPDLAWADAVHRHGAFHHVAVLGGTGVVRVSSAADHRARILREADVLRTVGALGLATRIPRLIGTVDGGAWSAMACTFVEGTVDADRPWHEVRGPFADVLADLAAAPLPTSGLPPARTWCGGSAWPEVVDRITAGSDLRATARAVVREVVTSSDDAPRSLVHGDLGPHNVVWDARDDPGLIDLDHAAAADPAVDAAPLVGSYGAAAVAQIVPADVLARAKAHRASLPLQVAAAAELAGDPALRDHALANFARRCAAGTLHDPAG
ncbi:phosphotransferase [Clavibacter michiganensis]|uniref:Phosphotransferase enzyme family protein n=1 Tax=Clavibacter michiganensis TaxID=28447 RepID=A0A251YJ90_9MICO|nr:phosphotransferase [Clavibacter michiganensis]OUE24128.1 Phosphotransferase enzyme family protein [Clavibacter michiganensis]